MSLLREVSKILYKTKLCAFFVIKKHDFKLRYFPTKISKRLWQDSFEKRGVYDLVDKLFFDSLRPEGVVIDVGANIGYYTLLSAQIVGQRGHVYSVEAHPKTFGYLERNVALNKYENITMFNVALGEKKGNVTFSDERKDDLNRVSDDGGIVVLMDKLDNLKIRHDTIHLLKIDVEGYEKFVMNGADETLRKTETIFFEAWSEHFDKYGYTLREIFDVLKEFGFIYLVNGEGGYEVIDENFKPDKCIDIIATKNPSKFIGL
ncbi:MAG: FkbM family methyltransferase [Legionella sp.]|nr:FkbM family methyltransferase [Legionella sp.]